MREKGEVLRKQRESCPPKFGACYDVRTSWQRWVWFWV